MRTLSQLRQQAAGKVGLGGPATPEPVPAVEGDPKPSFAPLAGLQCADTTQTQWSPGRAELSHHSLWDPRDVNSAAGALGEQWAPPSLQGAGCL